MSYQTESWAMRSELEGKPRKASVQEQVFTGRNEKVDVTHSWCILGSSRVFSLHSGLSIPGWVF